MAVSNNELKDAMKVLGIADIHIDKEQAKRIYKKLLMKWHPDSCPDGEEMLYNEISAKINSAYETIEKAYSEGLMGPSAKSYGSNYANNTVSNSSNTVSNPSNTKNTYNTQSSQGSYSSNNTTANNTSYDEPSGLDIIYYRYRWLNLIFLSVCVAYIIRAITYSPISDVYIENSVINLIKGLALYYAIYWFLKIFIEIESLWIPGILAWIIYKLITISSFYIYNLFDNSLEWLAMLCFLALFFICEYFVHIKKIMLTLKNNRHIKIHKSTKLCSFIMLFEYATIFIFGIYSVSLVHKFITIKNTIIPSWY